MSRARMSVVVTGIVFVISIALPERSPAQGRTPFCRNSKDAKCSDGSPGIPCTLDVTLSPRQGKCQVTNIEPGEFINRKTGIPRGVNEQIAAELEAALVDHQFQICIKDTPAWNFKNTCSSAIHVRIGNFRADQVILDRYSPNATGVESSTSTGGDTSTRTGVDSSIPEKPNGPIDPDCDLHVSVEAGKSAIVKCEFKSDVYKLQAQTYKYDILHEEADGHWSVMLDPEFELYP